MCAPPEENPSQVEGSISFRWKFWLLRVCVFFLKLGHRFYTPGETMFEADRDMTKVRKLPRVLALVKAIYRGFTGVF